MLIERIARRANDGGNVAPVGWQGVADIDLEPAAPGKRQHLFRNVGRAREPAHVRAGGTQQAQFAERGLPRADKNKDTGGGIEEQRQETHRANLPARSTIFLAAPERPMKREKYYGDWPN